MKHKGYYEIWKNAAVVVVLIFIKYNGLCGGVADLNYFYRGINTVHKFL